MKSTIILLTNVILICVAESKTLLISHKGFHNLNRKLNGECQAKNLIFRNAPPEFSVESIEQAFAYGADVVEIDLRLTKDKKLVLFHDWNMKCITGKNKNIGELTYEELHNKIDLGYNVSFDQGKSFPLRERGYLGPIAFKEVLRKFQNRKFLLNPKDKSDEEAEKIIEELLRSSHMDPSKFMLWGRERTHGIIKEKLPSFGHFFNNHWQSDNCLYDIRRFSFFGNEIPLSCRNRVITFDLDRTWLLPGWDHDLVDRLAKVNTLVYFFVPQANIPQYLKELYFTNRYYAFVVSDIKNFIK